ncbi:hypothetical protein KSF_010330 [Reticulibacter mediterranei]|uniref:Uncharacterized protein n=1 Tax=Reticulibacter mediterranei TaxID=2778369 RepID=A0A8J3N086_9CHLR|nr:hypothetical protein KSF_010330 [Reticulibacter mediterranei]
MMHSYTKDNTEKIALSTLEHWGRWIESGTRAFLIALGATLYNTSVLARSSGDGLSADERRYQLRLPQRDGLERR